MPILKAAPVLLLALAVLAHEGPEVTVKQGTLRGKLAKSRHGRAFSSFTGIPYAKPPVGELRFKPPVPAEPWEGILDATKPHAVCPQSNLFTLNTTIIGDEDCLYLNVYTPQLPQEDEKLLPVMFYIHGGGFFTGSATFHGPSLLLDKDVVLVTINYRLGPFGFLTTGDLNATGNDGLKDQNRALRWTKDNIASFGGDPDHIVVFGQSAGAASAHYHMLSPLSKGLIKGVIAQSGSALENWALMPHFLSTRRSKILAGNLGCPTYRTDEMMACLRKVDAYDIIKQTEMFVEWDIDPIIPFKPVIEPNLEGAFLSEDPIDIIISGNAAKVPFITGVTTNEGSIRAASLYSNPELVKELDQDFKKIAPMMLMYDEGTASRYKDGLTEQIRKFYFGEKPIDESTKPNFAEMFGDATMLSGVDTAVELHARFTKEPIYYYLFGYTGAASFCTIFGSSEDKDVCHCDDLLYLFNNDVFFPKYEPSDSDVKVSDFMVNLWTNFATHGNPTPEDSPVPKWEPVQGHKQNYYYIKSHDDVKLEEGLYSGRTKFWRNLEMNVRTRKISDELKKIRDEL